MKLVSVGIDPDRIGLNGTATVPIRSHRAVGGVFCLIILLSDTRNETATIFYNPTWKIKLMSVGIVLDRIEFSADYVPAELFGDSLTI